MSQEETQTTEVKANRNFVITETVLQQVINAVATQPYGNVHTLISDLFKLPVVNLQAPAEEETTETQQSN
jgi:hypothetical protein